MGDWAKGCRPSGGIGAVECSETAPLDDALSCCACQAHFRGHPVDSCRKQFTTIAQVSILNSTLARFFSLHPGAPVQPHLPLQQHQIRVAKHSPSPEASTAVGPLGKDTPTLVPVEPRRVRRP